MRHARQSSSQGLRHGFTLVELLVVIAIIGTLAALLLPAIQSAREAGRRATCINNQKNLAMATIGFATAKDKFPGSWAKIPGSGNNVATLIVVEWPVLLMPYYERNDIYTLVQASGVTNTSWPVVALLQCPSAPPTIYVPPLAYAANCGQTDNLSPSTGAGYDSQENGVFFNQYQSTATIPVVTQTLSYIAKWDGTSNTMLLSENMDAQEWFGEQAPNIGGGSTSNEWEIGITWSPTDTPTIGLNQQAGQAAAAAANQQQYYARPSSMHPGGFVVAMCDGSTKFLSQQIAYRVYGNLLSARGGAAKNPGTTTLVSYPSDWIVAGTSTAAGVNMIPISETDLNP